MGISQSQHILEAEDRCSNTREFLLDMYHSRQCVFLNAISVYPSVPVKAPFLPGGHLQATLPLSSPSCRACVQLIPKDQLQRPRENHWAYLIQHWIKTPSPLGRGTKHSLVQEGQWEQGGRFHARPRHCTTLTPPPSWCCLCHHVSHLQKNAAFSYFAHLFIIFFVEEARSLRATGWAILVYCGKIA